MMPIPDSVKQLTRSERGIMTVKLLSDFLNSDAVKGLDESNSQAVVSLTAYYMLGTGAMACEVKESLQNVIDHNQWVLK